MRAIDLFAGVGGIRLGFEEVFDDLETVFASEINKWSIKTYQANFKTPEITGDITKVNEKDIPDFDICLAGFPCQAFSMTGNRLGFEDSRGTLFFDVARICKEKQPKVIFCENVKGLRSHDKGRTFDVIKRTFDEIGYDLFYKVLDSKNYCVPQHRERIYMVAFRKDLNVKEFDFPEPTGTVCLGDILEDAPIKAKYFLSQQSYNTEVARLERNKAKGNGFGFRIVPLDKVGNTIVAYNQGRNTNCLVDDRGIDMSETNGKVPCKENVRYLTPRECFRMQGFPDSFILPCADINTFKQAGNSVTVKVIKEIAQKVKDVLTK